MFENLREYLPGKLGQYAPIVPVVRLQGVIGMATPLRSGLSLAAVAKPLEKAFSVKKAPAVALLVNSPGGSPVQSRLIFKRIRDLATKHEKEVLVFVEDVAASGGYMIALAGDEIIADETSIVGSIGVVSSGFGFTGLMEKIGVERRVYTAGEKKVTLDPFQPENPEEVQHLKSLQREVHDVFISMVKDRRGDVLADNPDLFSGQFWSGHSARDLGLVDSLGDLMSVLRARYGEDAEPKLFAPRRGLLGRKPSGNGVHALIGSTSNFSDEVISSLEARALWSRYGL